MHSCADWLSDKNVMIVSGSSERSAAYHLFIFKPSRAKIIKEYSDRDTAPRLKSSGSTIAEASMPRIKL